jgi:hypothetical protein
VRNAAKGAGETAVGFQNAGAAVNVRRSAAFFGDAGEGDVVTLERVLTIGEVRRVVGRIGEDDPFSVWFCWIRSQECLRPLALVEQFFELGAQIGFCIAIFYDYRSVQG